MDGAANRHPFFLLEARIFRLFPFIEAFIADTISMYSSLVASPTYPTNRT